MKRMLPIAIVLALFLLTPATAMAQGKTLESRIIESFRVYGPTWLLQSSEHFPMNDDLEREVLFFKWNGAAPFGEVMIFLHRSPEDAGRTLKRLVEVDAELELQKTILKNPEEKFGEESYAWEGRDFNKGAFGYLFRRGDAVVFTSSSSLKSAGQLASLTLRAID